MVNKNNFRIRYSVSFLLFGVIFLGLAGYTRGQTTGSINYLPALKNANLSGLWRSDSLLCQDDDAMIVFPEPLGYIGDQYQRFYIHYTSVVQSGSDPYLYEVQGKTRVKDNICSFSGTIHIRKAILNEEQYDSRYRQGKLKATVSFREDSTQTGSGIFEGILETDFCLDSTGGLSYNLLFLVADGYCNNQCRTTWTSYKTGRTKKCVWGDFRMPDSKKLDAGAGGVAIAEKYVPNGWQTFVNCYAADGATADSAREAEALQWWR